MMINISRSRLALAVSASLVASMSIGASQAFAQDAAAPQASAQTAVQLQAVEVTGSRIKGADMATQVPTVTISASELEKTGITNIGDILQQLSSSGAGLNTKFNSSGNFGSPPGGNGIGAGSSTLDLRNLGSNRVLILVDGVRWVNESSGSGVSGAVDMNTIPAGIIDHIEILQDGASALYGSDAIAGVVNIITKKSQNGASVDTYYGDYNNLGGAPTTTTNISYGTKTDRAEFFFNVSHLKQDGMFAAEWPQSSLCVPGIPASDVSECSSTSPGGSITLIDPETGARNKVITNDGVTGPASYPNDFHKFTNDDRYNYASHNLLLTPSKRSSVFASFIYNVTDNVKWYARALYNNRKSENIAAPVPVVFGADGGSETFTDHIDIDATNPYNPFGRTMVSGVDYGLIQKRLTEDGNRTFLQDVDTTYFTTGLQGHFDLGQKSLFWDVNYANGINKASASFVQGAINMRNLQRALGPVANCTDTCVPLNVFGDNSVTPAMLNYIQYDAVDRSQNKIQLFTANLSGEVFDLPAGPFSFAAGGEHRKYSGYFIANPLTTNGDDGSIPVPPTSGSYSISEGYLELHIPVLADVPFFKALDVSAATRYSDYSNFGGTTNSKLGVRWQVVNDLTLRSTVALGFRAPALGELYAPPSGFGATLLDPCTEPVANAQTEANCRALGVPAGFQQNNTQITVNTGGNANLKPETSHSVTAGAVYSPSWITGMGWADRFDISLNYYKIKITNAIAALDSQTVLNNCVASGSATSEFCKDIHRTPSGDIGLWNNFLRNIGFVNTSGWDFGINWRSPATSVGVFTADWVSTYTAKYEEGQADTIQPRSVGLELKDSAIPRIKSTLRLGWNREAWSVNTTFRYISSLNEDCANAVGYAICTEPDLITPTRPTGTHPMSAVVYQDLRASWKLPISLDLTLSAGINNLWNKAPPICISCTLNGYDASTYDLPSRFTYVQARLNF